MPFASVRSQIENARPQINTSFAMNTTGKESNMAMTRSFRDSPVKSSKGNDLASMFKNFSEVGNVPFSHAHRGRADDAHDRNNTLAKTAFAWKAPTVMQ